MTALITDILILSVLFISAAISFFRGFIKEILTIVGFGGAVIAALLWGKSVAPFILELVAGFGEGERKLIFGIVPADIVATVLSYMAVFFLTFAVLAVISHFIGKAVHDMGLNAVDRTLGFVFGIARGFLLVGVLFIIITWIVPEDRPAWLSNAKMTPIMLETAEIIKNLVPEDKIGSMAKDKIEQMNKKEGEKDNAPNSAEELMKMKDLENLLPPDGKSGKGYDDVDRKALDQLFKQTDE